MDTTVASFASDQEYALLSENDEKKMLDREKLLLKVKFIRESLIVTKEKNDSGDLGLTFVEPMTDEDLLKLMRGLDPNTAKKIDALSDEDVSFILEQIRTFEKESESSEFIKTTQNIALYFTCMENKHEGDRHEKLIQKEMKFLMEKFIKVAKGRKRVEAVFRAYLVDILTRKVTRWFKSADNSRKFTKLATTILLSGIVTTILFYTVPQIPGIPLWVHILILSAAASLVIGLGIYILV